MKIEQVRKIKSIESEFLKLSRNDKVQLCTITRSAKSLSVEMHLFDNDIGSVKVSIQSMSQSHVENLKIILEMLQGSV